MLPSLMSQHCRIKELSLCGNQIPDTAANALATLLRTIKSLISLNLYSISNITLPTIVFAAGRGRAGRQGRALPTVVFDAGRRRAGRRGGALATIVFAAGRRDN